MFVTTATFINTDAPPFDELVKDAYDCAMGYLGKDCGIQTAEKRHRTFLNLVLKIELREAV